LLSCLRTCSSLYCCTLLLFSLCLLSSQFSFCYTMYANPFHTFFHLVQVKEIIVVCDPSYKDIFEGFSIPLVLLSFLYHVFALPLGYQDSFFAEMQRKITKQNSNFHYLEKQNRILFIMAFRNVQSFNLNNGLFLCHSLSFFNFITLR